MKKRDVVLNTEAHRPAFNEFADALAEAGREGWSSADVLRRFIDASFLAIRGRFLSGEQFEKNEAEYMAIVGACRRPKETMTALSKMLGCVGVALQAEPVDFVGPVFSVLSADSHMGQFFTPFHISYFMAKVAFDEPRTLMAGRPFLRCSEPACGVGGMILAANQVLREAGLDVAREAHWSAIDIDSRAHRACFLQLALTDCSADVFRGNALGPLDELEGVRTPAAIMWPKRDVENIDQPAGAENRHEPAVPEPGNITENITPAQLSLF